MKNYTLYAIILSLIILIGSIILYIIKSERKIKQLQQKNIVLEISSQTLKKNIEQQNEIYEKIYHANEKKKKNINKIAYNMTIKEEVDMYNFTNLINKTIISFNND